MTPDIRELDAETRDRIAAGEVVERPASVVKELVENALDADANRIEVAAEAGGTDRIVVADDGIGMSESDARMAVREHTTSKLDSIDDLDAIGTLGFRGEALHAIGSVARLRIETKPRGGTRGTALVVEHGEIISCEPVGCPEGTRIEVTELFGAVPARRKYLKTEATEFDHVQKIVSGYALARPDIAVSLTHDDRETFSTTGDGDRRNAVMAVYGRDVASAMIDIEADGSEGPLSGVEGLVSHPETNRAGREYMTTLIDGRYVTAGTVREAIVDAYGGQLAPDRYPFAVVDLAVPPGGVDVNVHPRKMQVMYREPEEIRRQVRAAVEETLRKEGILRSSAPRGRSAPDQATIEPSSTNEDTDNTDDTTADSTGDPPTSGTTESNVDGANGSTAADVDTRPSPDTESTQTTSSWSSCSASRDTPARSTSSGSPSESSSRSPPTDSTPSSKSPPRPTQSKTPQDPGTQTTLSGDDAHTLTEYDNFPDLRVLGQLHDTYIITEANDGLILIDQHAADERINYERLQDQFEGDTTTQALADPVEIKLTSGEAAVFDAYTDALAQLGFHSDRIDDRTIRVSTVPAVVAKAAGPELILDVITDLVADKRAAEETVEAVADDLLSDLACHPSITGNTSLTEGSVVDILSALDECKNPWACPHGRPVLIQFDSDEIDDRFERDYPGH